MSMEENEQQLGDRNIQRHTAAAVFLRLLDYN